ncbi:MAG: 30S ribosomal protein S2 [Candidatus Doudnabacteria bacterium CG10_big_fil_rev_8_21_14_0_10_41_10]|uniref:Small ribosomal subunit protein uS2 n=1 Tax=Candidatus Doudnabacteria bacterium CG10_big_fil_rev_8_21_14_0_10_41_10 TaxID=1974551 RepID=A0A2H0VEQ7_9BACT|nr:MAG: 30S ribosomal protein S2 [Candidatus Doudnabacteria bacterium CG10_big_fil_rev_8_21_14_0_10_41_10]
MSELTLEELLKAGAHFGHRASRWNPKMASYIFTTRNKFHIIDLEKTYQKIKQAQDYITETVGSGGKILFVGTKKQSKALVKKHAQACGMPYVTERWLGGTLTNFRTIQRSIKKMSSIEELLKSDRIKNYTKKEQLMMKREMDKSILLFEGVRDMKKPPEAVFVVDTGDEVIAVREAHTTGVKVIGITDTSGDPSMIDFIIPANDDASKAIDLITGYIADAVNKGKAGDGKKEINKIKS